MFGLLTHTAVDVLNGINIDSLERPSNVGQYLRRTPPPEQWNQSAGGVWHSDSQYLL